MLEPGRAGKPAEGKSSIGVGGITLLCPVVSGIGGTGRDGFLPSVASLSATAPVLIVGLGTFPARASAIAVRSA